MKTRQKFGRKKSVIKSKSIFIRMWFNTGDDFPGIETRLRNLNQISPGKNLNIFTFSAIKLNEHFL